MAHKAEQQGILDDILDAIIEVLNSKHAKFNIRNKGEIGSSIPELASYVINIISLDRGHDIKRIYKYIKQFTDTGWTDGLFVIYVKSLLETKQFLKINEIFKLELTPVEFQSMITQCAKYDLENRGQDYLEAIDNTNHSSLNNFCLLFLLLHNKRIDFVPPLPSHECFPATVPEYETGKRSERAKIFSENFIVGIIYGLLGKETEVCNWMKNAGKRWALGNYSGHFFII